MRNRIFLRGYPFKITFFRMGLHAIDRILATFDEGHEFVPFAIDIGSFDVEEFVNFRCGSGVCGNGDAVLKMDKRNLIIV